MQHSKRFANAKLSKHVFLSSPKYVNKRNDEVTEKIATFVLFVLAYGLNPHIAFIFLLGFALVKLLNTGA